MEVLLCKKKSEEYTYDGVRAKSDYRWSKFE